MRFWVRTFTALLLVGAAFATFGIAVSHLADTGSCSTGGTPDNLPDCPADTVWWILSIFGALLSLVVGVGVFTTRGSRGETSSASTGPVTTHAPVTTYGPKPPPLPATRPAGEDANVKGEDEDEEGDPLDRLAKLGELKQAGVISESEFELQKAKLLGDI